MIDIQSQAFGIETKRASFMTGATGFLGRQFLLRYLKSDFGDIYVLVRADSVHAGRERVIRSLEFAAADVGLTLNVDDLRKIRIVVGDIVDNICGINPKTLEIIRENGVNDFWHYAASLKYEDKNKEEIISANLDGTTGCTSNTGKPLLLHFDRIYIWKKNGAYRRVPSLYGRPFQ